VDERGDRGRPLHRVGQPDLERQLGRLRQRAHEEQRARQEECRAGIRAKVFQSGGAERADTHGSGGRGEGEDPDEERRVADAVHDEGLHRRIGGRRPFALMADEQV